MSIVESVVHPVSGLPAGVPTLWTNSNISYDYAVGGLPFLSAASPQLQLTRRTAPYTKSQVDSSTEPGEQTLVAWWLRSQSSFHMGTGIVFEEPLSDSVADETIQYRYADSAGVDVWTAGQVTLLNTAPLDNPAAAPIVMGAIDTTGSDCYFLADGNTVVRGFGNGSNSPVPWGGGDTVVSMTNDGSNYYIADDVSVWSGDLDGGAGTALWNTGVSAVILQWSKGRLMAGIGPSIYELAGGSPPTLPTPLYTHPNAEWAWTSITDSPQAIYAAGYAGGDSSIFMFTLDTSGELPTLTGGIVVAQLPEGEVIQSIYGYLGSYVAIGTNKGVRIADVESDGTLQYGPLTVSIPEGSDPVTGIVGQDRYLYGSYMNGVNGQSGLWRIDLGTALGFKQFAWAADLSSHFTGTVNSVCLMGASGRLVFTVDGQGAFVQSVNALEANGYLTTGNIRFHILDPKLFKKVRILCLPLTNGSINISVGDHAGNNTSLVTFTGGLATDPLAEVAYPVNYGPQEFTSLTIGLARDSSDPTLGPTVTGYQIKALPAQKRQRTYILPLLCFDSESDRNGAKHGTVGSALQRLIALETVEEAGDVVQFQDLTNYGQSVRQVVIDDITFTQTDSPKSAAQGAGWGGVIQLTVRSVS